MKFNIIYILLCLFIINFAKGSKEITISSLNSEIISNHVLRKLNLKDISHFKSTTRDNRMIVDQYYSQVDDYPLDDYTSLIRKLLESGKRNLLIRAIHNLLKDEKGIQQFKIILSEFSWKENH